MPEKDRIENEIYLSLKRYATVFVIIVILVSVLVLLGWQFDIDILKRPLPDSVVMKPMTAIAFILSGLSLLILLKDQKSKKILLLSKIFSVATTLIGIIRIAELIFRFDTGLGQLLFGNKLSMQLSEDLLNYMSINSAGIFILLGSSLFLLAFNFKRAKQFANYIMFIVFVIGLFSFVTYLYGNKGEEYQQILGYFPVSVYASGCFMFIASAILFYNSSEGFMQTFTNPFLGGIISRLMILPIILIPILFGYIWLFVNKKNNYGTETGIALLITVIFVIFFFFIWYLSTALNNTDAQRYKALERIRFLAAIAENIQDPIITTDLNYLITDWNDAAERLFGWKKEEALGKTSSDLLKAIFQDGSREEIVASYRKTGHWQGEAIQYTKNGKAINTLVTSSNIKDSKGNVTGNITLIRNITKRVKAEQELQKLNEELEQKIKERTEEISRNEKHFRSIIENNDGIISLLDENLNIIFRSHSSERVTGWEIGERKIIRPIDEIYPEDKVQLLGIINKARSNEGTSYEIAFRTLHKDGHYIWLEGTITNMLNAPDLRAFIVNLHDVSKLKEAEQELQKSKLRLQLSLDAANIGIYDADFVKQTAFWDKRTYEFWGIPEGTTIKPMDFLKGVHPDDIERVEKEVREAFHQDADPKNYQQYRVVDARTGTVRWLDMKGELFYEKGQPVRYVGTALDITEQKKTEEKLKELNEQLRDLSAHMENIREEERSYIAHEIHDELGQQMTGLKMDLAWLKNNIIPDTQEVSRRLNDMLEMVNFSIQSIRKIIIELRPGILDDLGLEAALEWLSKEFEQKTNIKVLFKSDHLRENLSKQINTAVFRIFQESLTNIAKHSRATVITAKLYENINFLYLEIKDNGIGISDDRRNNTKSFGLLGMKERAAILKGDLSIQKLPEGGTGVILKIPLTS